MTALIKHHPFIPAILTMAPLLLWSHQTHAATFTSSTTITYTVSSITNLDNPGSLADLAITGAFEVAPPPDYLLNVTGDATLTNSNPSLGPIAVGSRFSHTFTLSGVTHNGSLDASILGLFGLNLQNNGNDNYQIALILDYQLQALAQDDYATTEVSLDYFDANNTVSGADFITAAHFSENTVNKFGSSGVLNVSLGAQGSQAVWADANITGHLQASPVPLPAGSYLLLTGLAGIVSLARKPRRSEV